LLLKPINLLILDEPTNHLDLHSKDVLLDALRRFNGTVIFVSHDRAFIEGLATRVLELTAEGNGIPSRVRNFPGNYRYYLERIEREAAEAAAATAVPGVKSVGGAGPTAGVSGQSASATGPASSYEDEKRMKAERRKFEKEEARLLEEIGAAEENLKAQETALADPAVYSDGMKSRKVQAEIEKLNALIEDLSADWEKLVSQMEEK